MKAWLKKLSICFIKENTLLRVQNNKDIGMYYGNTDYGLLSFQAGGILNWKDFCLKTNIPRENYEILRIGVMGIRILDFTTLPAVSVSVKMAD